MTKDKPKSRWDVTMNMTNPLNPGMPGAMPPNPLYPGAMPPQPMYGPPTLQPYYNSGRVTLGGNAARGYVQPTPGSNAGIVVPYNGDPGRQYVLQAEERTEPVVGWRRYSLGGEGSDELTLYGQRVEWPEATLVAICQADIDTAIFAQLSTTFGDKGVEVYKAYAATRGVENSGQRLAAEHIRDGFCQCGIYGGGTPDQTMGSGQVLAKCQAWGYVAVDDNGNWKATHARIEAMWLLKGQMTFSHWVDFARVTAFLRQRYGCPVFVVEDVDEVPR